MVKHGRLHNSAGFSLIELIIVMAITSLLALSAFAGQRALRARAQFDAAVDKIVATVADAHNQALAGVNTTGTGDGTATCGGGPAGQYVFAGTAWTVDNASPNPIALDYYKALPGSVSVTGSCKFDTQSFSLSAPVTVSVQVGALTQPRGKILFVRNNTGGLSICPWTNLLAGSELASYRSGTCTNGTFQLNLSDADGHTSQVLVDKSGLAKRLN